MDISNLLSKQKDSAIARFFLFDPKLFQRRISLMNIIGAFVLGCSLLAPGDSVAGFVSVDHNPGTEVWCLMSLERQIHLSCVEACPNFCQSNISSSDIVAKYNKVSRLCECYTAFGVCEQSSMDTGVNTFYITGKIINLNIPIFPFMKLGSSTGPVSENLWNTRELSSKWSFFVYSCNHFYLN